MYLRKLSYCAMLLALLFVVACGGSKEESSSSTSTPAKPAAPSGGNAYDPAKSTASITGKAKFEGAKPNLVKLQMSADAVCMKAHSTPVMDQSVIINDDGTLQNVFVYVKQGAEKWTYQTPTTPVEIDQQGCLYHPHVLGIMVNQPLTIKNGDPTLHNIHPQPKINTPFNLAQPMINMQTNKTFDKVEVMIPVKCDVHRWMESYIGVLSHPFYSVTGTDGSFTIKGLPAGTYTIEAWHEKYGSQTANITVTDGQAATNDFTFKAS
ncbi:MAG TPA: carboxypeptidase regulatory-like domain-containing protein [Acidobacteriota bacterium]